jgi:hypothetical protein
MAILNNIYFNACYTGALEGILTGRPILDPTQADYLGATQAAQAIATRVDSKIAFDALVTTNANVTQLAITTNTIAANEQWRAGLLQGVTRAAVSGRNLTDATAADYDAIAIAIAAAWNEGILLLVTP